MVVLAVILWVIIVVVLVMDAKAGTLVAVVEVVLKDPHANQALVPPALTHARVHTLTLVPGK